MTRIHLVAVRSDPSHIRFIRSLNRPDAGVVSTLIRPSGSTAHFGWIARDLLASMGISRDVSGVPRNDSIKTSLVTAWLAGREISDVIIIGAESLLEKHTTRLIDIAHIAGANLWLVADGELSETLLDTCAEWPTTTFTQAEFDAHWQHRNDGAPDPYERHPGRWPREVAASDFLTFLADSIRLLDPQAGHLVRDLYKQKLDTARAQMITSKACDEIGDQLRPLIADAATRSQLITTVRAFQAAAFLQGHHVKVNLDVLFGAGCDSMTATANDPETWLALCAYHSPDRAVICALTMLGWSGDAICSLAVSDTDLSGRHINVEGEPVDLPNGSELFLRSQIAVRMMDGASGSDPLFVNRKGRPLTTSSISQIVNAAQTELGLAVAPIRVANDTSRPWHVRHGVTVRSMMENFS